jgi:hypothetical protein
MPQPIWKHMCRGREVHASAAHCRTCGRRGRFTGWRLTFAESLARYQYVHGLVPTGSHRALADRLFVHGRTICERCDGHGVLGEHGCSWRACPWCEGTGGFWTLDMDTVSAIRRTVIERYPESAAPIAGIRFLTASPVLDLETGAMANAPSGSSAADRPPYRTLLGPSRSSEGAATASATRRSRRRRTRPADWVTGQRVERALVQARRELGTEWRLKGLGHCRRVTMKPWYGRSAAVAAPDCWQWVTPARSWSARRLFPLALVERAAEILGVPVERLVSREFA